VDGRLSKAILWGAVLLGAYLSIMRLGPQALTGTGDSVTSTNWTADDLRRAFVPGRTTKAEVIAYLSQHGIQYRQTGNPPLYDRLDVYPFDHVGADSPFSGHHQVLIQFDNHGIYTGVE
jgi:hypothetical protein